MYDLANIDALRMVTVRHIALGDIQQLDQLQLDDRRRFFVSVVVQQSMRETCLLRV